jgi:hypothetical protein
MLRARQRNLEAPRRIAERIVRDVPEIRILPARRPQPAIFKLPHPPEIRKLRASPRQKLFSPLLYRSRIENYKSVERNCLDLANRLLRPPGPPHCTPELQPFPKPTQVLQQIFFGSYSVSTRRDPSRLQKLNSGSLTCRAGPTFAFWGISASPASADTEPVMAKSGFAHRCIEI